jgi:SOS-response transcriptional repressor LexA
MSDMLKTQILERIDATIKKLGISERALSMRANNTPDLVRNWRTKDVLPRLDTLIQVANALGRSPEWLAFGAGAEDKIWIPRISWVNAGSFGVADSVDALDDHPKIEVAGLPPGEYVALDVVGDSMDRISPPGSIVIVDRSDRRLVHNACYVVQDGEGGATYKRYRQSPIRFEPVSNNPEHEPLYPENDNLPTIFGRVVRSTIDLT